MRRVRNAPARFVLLAALVLIGGAPLAAGATTEDAPIAGGTAALARALGIDPVPDRARFLTELTRVVYDMPEGVAARTDALLQTLATHLDVVGRFQTALAAVQPPGGSITLATASRKTDRDRLKAFLDLVGLRLREKNTAFIVEPTDNKQAAERVRLLTDLGINLSELATRLNTGDAARIEVPIEAVPVPLSAAVWSRAVFQRPVAVGGLFAAIVSDRRAALVSHGLAALDDETLQFLSDHPAIITRLYEHDAGAFAAFGESLRVRGGRIVVPGGDAAVALWEAALDEKIGRPERFIRGLFGNDGHIAYLYDTLAHLDAPRTAFALGLSIANAALRAERFKLLASTIADSRKSWDVKERPFSRPANDTAAMLARVRAERGGEPARPRWRLLWTRAFESLDIPDHPARQLENLQDEGMVDAAWLADAVQSADLQLRAERLDQLAFGQRVFAATDDAALPDVLVALRAFQRYRMLMLSLERIGVKAPAVYATAALRARRLSALDANRGFVAVSQFQGSLALLARMARVGSLDAPRIEAVVTSLCDVPLDDDGRYAGGLARWMQQTLLPALGSTGDADTALAAALAGPRSHVPAAAPTLVSWENRTYRLDLSTPELNRLTSVRQKLGGEPVRLALELEQIAGRLSAPGVAIADVNAVKADLEKRLGEFAPAHKQKSAPAAVLPPGVDAPKSSRDIVKKTIEELAKINKPNDLKKASRQADRLLEVVDDTLADALLSLTYALDLGDPEGTALFAGNVGRRHDFGFDEKTDQMRVRTAWARPQQVVAAGTPWHVRGSLLGLDTALASLALRRTATDRILGAPVLTVTQRDTFSETVVLLNPFALRDADRDAIAAAITRGRARVAALGARFERLDAIADEIGMDGWRRRAIGWTLDHDPQRVMSFFSLTDLLYLGRPDQNVLLNAWGMAARAFDGCPCTELLASGGWTNAIGRLQVGLLSAYVADLNLHVASMLGELGLPAALAKGVLAAATQDYIDDVKPLHLNDWLTLVRAAQAVPKERIEDYVAALTASGPLVPDSGSGVNRPLR